MNNRIGWADRLSIMAVSFLAASTAIKDVINVRLVFGMPDWASIGVHLIIIAGCLVLIVRAVGGMSR